jgi:chemotaxis family two-component system response regulator Rcp1
VNTNGNLPVRILVVEDNRVDATLVRYALKGVKNWPVELEFVEDGEQALHFLEKKNGYAEATTPDLVILDLNLPKRDGVEVLRAIREQPTLTPVKVIVLSSSPIDVIEQRVRSVDIEASCCFTKPLGFDEVMELGEKIRQCYLSI